MATPLPRLRSVTHTYAPAAAGTTPPPEAALIKIVIRDYDQNWISNLPEQAKETEFLFCRRWHKKFVIFVYLRDKCPTTNSVATNKKAIHQKENHLGIRILQSPAFDRSLYFPDWPLFDAVSPG